MPTPVYTIFRFGLYIAASIATAGFVTACGSVTPSTVSSAVAPSLPGAAADTKYAFKTIDNDKDPTFNQLLGISRSKQIVGYYGSGASGHPNKGYRVSPPYKQPNFAPENVPHSMQTQVTAINNLNDTAGFWVDSSNATHGFIHWNGFFKSYSYQGSTVTQILGLNNSGQAVGFYTLASTNYGFELNRVTGEYTAVAPSGASNVTATAINNAGDIVGFYTSGSQTIGFLKFGSKYTPLNYPGSTVTMPSGINNHGDVVGAYVDSSDATHGFLVQSPTHNPQWKSFDDPNGVGSTTINGLNDRTDMVGFYVDSSGHTDGMLIKPI